MKIIVVIKFLYLLLCNKQILCYQELNLMPIIGIEMSPVGFHRELTYFIHFDYPIAGKECEYFIEQSFPSGVYVNVDQLNDLVRFKKLEALYPYHIDIEIPTEQAQPFHVLLSGRPKISDSIVLPIHFRYHAPRKTNFVKVEIDNPLLYFKCLDENDTTDYIPQTNQSYCIQVSRFIPEEKLIFSAKHTPEVLESICGWRLLEYDLHLKSSLTANIPVGDLNLYKFVFLYNCYC